MPDQVAKQKFVEELHQISAVIEQITGLRTNWNGEFEFVPLSARYRGLKPFSCNILLREDLVDEDIRWRTMIHESFHAVSAGYNQIDFDQNVGWEEGVVEQLQRLFRSRILASLNVMVAEDVFEAEDKRHPFNLYIGKLTIIRHALGTEEEDFFLELIAIPIKDRYRHLFNLAMRAKNKNAIAALSAAKPFMESTNYANLTKDRTD